MARFTNQTFTRYYQTQTDKKSHSNINISAIKKTDGMRWAENNRQQQFAASQTHKKLYSTACYKRYRRWCI